MSFFEPLEPPKPLPVIGSAVERAVMDFKDYRAHRAWKAFEYAKDVAAFANHLGGTLVIGANEDGHLREYVGLTDDEATEVRQRFSNAVARYRAAWSSSRAPPTRPAASERRRRRPSGSRSPARFSSRPLRPARARPG